MNYRIVLVTLILPFFMMCNTTFLNHKDFEFKVKDLVWNTKIEGQVGEIYFKDSNFIFGRNCDSTFVVISPDNGSVVTTLNPYLVEKERACLIIDGTGENKGGYSLYNVPVDNRRYSKVTLKMIDRQYRGDTETSYLIVNTLTNKEFTILFNRRQFPSISDIAYFKEGKFVVKYNVEAGSISRNLAAAGTGDKKYMVNIGLFDLEKIISE